MLLSYMYVIISSLLIYSVIILSSWRLKSPATWQSVQYLVIVTTTKTSKFRITDHPWGESIGARWIPLHNAESVSMTRPLHEKSVLKNPSAWDKRAWHVVFDFTAILLVRAHSRRPPNKQESICDNSPFQKIAKRAETAGLSVQCIVL